TPIAFADVWGDGTPEMLLMSALKYENFAYGAHLRVYTLENGGLKQLYDSGDYGLLDAQAGGGDNYRIFRSGSDKNLWVYVIRYSEGSEETYTRLSTEGKMEPELTFIHSSYPAEDSSSPTGWATKDEWSVNGKACSQAEYEAKVPSCDEILMRNALLYSEYGSEEGTQTQEPVYPEGSAMTYDAAVDYLRGELGTLPGSSVDEKAFFAQLPEQFSFCSGVGGWSSDISIGDDGTFVGSHHDSDMGDIGDGYPNGTMYLCTFSGRFGNVTRVNDYTYSMHLLELNIDPMEDQIEDGVRYIASVPYGLENADEVTVYLPGAYMLSLPWDFVTWVGMPNAWGNERPLLLPFYGLYNVAEEEGWFSEYGVSVCRAEDVAGVFAEYDEFIADKGEPQTSVVISAYLAVTDFKLLSLTVDSVSDEGRISFSTKELCTRDRLEPGKPLLVKTVFQGDSPSLGFSYVDAAGTEHRCAIAVSGYDGSLYSYEF
ncbi:MAG: hypothetical protein J5449_12735, partial [Oscillospiraceae bacterium]|nr:hypothetical protein [Oscillospiraceae bacterium]